MSNYTQDVKFSVTGKYGCGPKDEDDVYTIEEFLECVKDRAFIDYDGYGHPVKDKKSDLLIDIQPSSIHLIPEDATHIIWFNR